MEVYNPREVREDGSAIIHLYQPMNPYTSLEIVLECYSASSQPVEINPQLSCEVVLSPLDDTAVSDGTFTIDRVELQAGPQILLEFTSVPGRFYRVQEITS